ncbi:hypothetical protein LguiA_008566 [Lonicera macranthoides]
MSEKKGFPIVATAMLVLYLMVQIDTADATTYIVGDSKGWQQKMKIECKRQKTQPDGLLDLIQTGGGGNPHGDSLSDGDGNYPIPRIRNEDDLRLIFGTRQEFKAAVA